MKFFTKKAKKKKSIDDIARGGGAAKADPFMTVLTTVPVKEEEPVKKEVNYVNLSDRDLERAEKNAVKRAERKAWAAAKKKKVAKKSQSKEAPMKKKTTPSTNSKRKLKKKTSSLARRSSSLTRPTPVKEETMEEVKTEETEETKEEVKTDAKKEEVPFPESSVMHTTSVNDRKGRKNPSKGKSQRSKSVTSKKKKTVSIDASSAPEPSANVNNLASPAQSVNTLKVDNRQNAKEKTPKKAYQADMANTLAELDELTPTPKDASAVDVNVDVVVDDAPQPQGGVLSWFQSTVMSAFPEEEFKTIGWMESVDYTVDDSVTTGNTGDDDRTIETYSTYGSASYVTAASAATDCSHTTGDSYTSDESGTVGSRTTGSYSQYSTDYTEDSLARINEDEEHDAESAPSAPSSMLSKFNIFKKNKRSTSPELKLTSAARSRSSSLDLPNGENSNSSSSSRPPNNDVESKESAPEEESADASKDEESAKKPRLIGSRRVRTSTPPSVASTRSKSSKLERFIARANSSSPANIPKKASGTRTIKSSPATSVRQTKRTLSPAIFDKVLSKTRASTPVSMSDVDSLPAKVPKKASGTRTVKTSPATSTGVKQTKRSLSPAIFDKVLSKTRASTPVSMPDVDSPRIVPHAGTCSLDGVINEAEDMIATAELDGVMDEAEEMIAKADFLPSKFPKCTVVDDGTNNISVEVSVSASVSIDETRDDKSLQFPVVEEETPEREDPSALFDLISVGTDELMAQAQELLMTASA